VLTRPFFSLLPTPLASLLFPYPPLFRSEPVTIGNVTIATGDFLLGDRDGVVIIPRELAAEVVTRTEEVVSTESEMRQALIGGMRSEERRVGKGGGVGGGAVEA